MGKWPDFEYHVGKWLKYDRFGSNSSQPTLRFPPWTLATLGDHWRPLATIGDMPENGHFGDFQAFSGIENNLFWDTLLDIEGRRFCLDSGNVEMFVLANPATLELVSKEYRMANWGISSQYVSGSHPPGNAFPKLEIVSEHFRRKGDSPQESSRKHYQHGKRKTWSPSTIFWTSHQNLLRSR